MKMTATIELEFESAGDTTQNAMDGALIRGLEALKKGIELRDDGESRRSIKLGSTKWDIVWKCQEAAQSTTQAAGAAATRQEKEKRRSTEVMPFNNCRERIGRKKRRASKGILERQAAAAERERLDEEVSICQSRKSKIGES